MVATRKQPFVPPPPLPTSKSNSSKGKAPVTLAPTLQETLSNGARSAASTHSFDSSDSVKIGSGELGTQPKKHQTRSKKDKKKKRKSERGFWDFLIHLSLLLFAAYTLTVCTKPEAHNSPVCHGLAKYKELILEPYLFPLFHRVIEHPSVSPYVARVQPHINTAVRVTTPVLRRGQEEWNGRVVPTWNARVVPQWNKRVVPVWNQYASPYVSVLEQKYDLWKDEGNRCYSLVAETVEPYRVIVTPYVVTARNVLVQSQQLAQPYVILAAHHTHKGYVASKPYLIIIWEHIQFYFRQFLKFIGQQRKQFVDPHVARILEKVAELSTADPTPSGTKEDSPADPQAAVPPPAPVVEKVVEEEDTVPPPTGTGSPSSTTLQTTTSQTTTPLSSSAETLTETPTEGASTVGSNAPKLTTTSESTVASSASASQVEITSSSHVINTTPTSTMADIPVVPENQDYEDEFDINEFARDLGLDEPEQPPSSVVTQETPKPREETEEEKAERIAQRRASTAKKRADIEMRHNKFEAELAALVKEKKKSLRKALVAIRKPAAVELENSEEIKGSIASLLAEADRYVKGAEAFLKTLEKETKEAKVKVALWDKVVEKVAKKFQDRLKETEDIVNGWHMQVLNQEMAEVTSASTAVKELADAAQVSVGMDWTWLDDVTAKDWQRYHDLIRVSENFDTLAHSIQKGTVPSPPINPILPILDDLEAEVEDIVTGFETRLRQLKREGSRNLTREETGRSTSASDPEVSILPIVPEDEASGPEVGSEIPSVIITRSKEEVVDAMRRAGAEDAVETVGVQKESGTMVESLAHPKPSSESAPAGFRVEL